MSKLLLSDTVQAALMNAIDKNLGLDQPQDLDQVKKGILDSLKSLALTNSTGENKEID